MELFLYSLLKNKGVSVKLSGTSHLVLDCFYCGREGKLYYNFNKHIGDCKVCQVYVTLLDIEKQYKISNYKKAPSLKNIKNKLKTIDQSSLESDLLEVQLPEECEPVRYHKLAKNFLWQRGIADTDSLLFCPSGYYVNRIIVPIYTLENKLVGFQARTVFSHVKQKYLFNKGFQKNKVIFQPHYLSSSPILVVENVFNAMWLGGVATFGRQLSDIQINLLTMYKKPICFLWDYDSFTSNTINSVLQKVKNIVPVKALLFTNQKPQPDNWSKKQLLNGVSQAFKSNQIIFRMETLR